jgi:hypothetical protein
VRKQNKKRGIRNCAITQQEQQEEEEEEEEEEEAGA